MIKKLAFVAGIIVLSTTTVQAKDYGAAGCGVGSMIFDGQSGLGPHVLAATTNGFYGTQTFAMTSGTLGCDVSGTIQSHAALDFINGNMERVAQAIAIGEGEALVALADTLEVKAEDRVLFNTLLKSNFTTIYVNERATALEVHSAILALLAKDERLAYAG